ncbi:bifunctional uridylyltransferase/uridylyl-removing protein GlnD [Orbus sturtevantii]|uniref:bifunctional uridylyltransferase/uridylyl-removing protein GlnD n=1 Tax=Orbus sturtevantii TaxID=3074109 RepID=UPI00370D21FE
MNASTYSHINLPFSPLDFSDEQLNLNHLKVQLDNFRQWSITQFKANVEIEVLIVARAKFIDQLLNRLWQFYQIPQQSSSLFKRNRIALIAVGGYGRGELHPLSDVDILILSDKPLNTQLQEKMGQLIRLLWDLHLDVGHSVRTLKMCLQEATADITIMTNLLESRLVVGNQTLLNELQQHIFTDKIWPSQQFYQAKVKEQQQRHKQYHSTSYNLEPDLKNGPGSLRDIQTIQWIALRHFGGISLQEITKFNYLTVEEIEEINNCRRFLWKIRFALHTVISRYDNRLLFDRQLSIAHLLGYQGERNEPVEKMMRDYYRVVHNVTELNQMLLQLFEESILTISHHNKPYSIDDYFQIRDKLIDVKDNNLFTQDPSMILQLFHTILLNPHVTGIYSNTIRQLRSARRKISGLLSDIPKAREHFLAIIKHPDAIRKALLPMHQFGILSVYIPGWKRIVGMMQFDLFHAYTVDEHTIRLLLEIADFSTEEGKKKHPNSSKVYFTLDKPELLTITALYHDIAKGRAGDHSEIGAKLVKEFCLLHDIEKSDSELICWLVQNHLLMSVTAQSRDIQDPVVISEFVNQVNSKKRLKYLLCLTVADVCATNETLWNSWKQSLMRELYLSTKHVFDLENHQIPAQRSIVRLHKKDALHLLIKQGYHEKLIIQFWQDYRFDYFLRYTVEQIVWHAKNLLTHNLSEPLVFINEKPFHGGTEICIYSPDRPYLFATVSNELSKRNLTIHDALIITNKKEFALDTFIVLEPNGQLIALDRHHNIKESLEKALKQTDYKRAKIKPLSSKIRHFSVPTQVNFLSTLSDRKTYMELIALDRPGLLARVGEVFSNLDISLRSAKIVTIGEHVEDLFVLTDKHNRALDAQICHTLRQEIVAAIESMDA